jgi:hypothetical protein
MPVIAPIASDDADHLGSLAPGGADELEGVAAL